MSRLAWRLPSAEEARLNAGFFCPQDTPLLVARHHVPAAGTGEARERLPPGESSAGGTQRTPPTTRCEAHGLFGSCVLPAARRDPRTLRVRCAEAVALADELLADLPSLRPTPSALALDALSAALTLDVRSLTLLLGAGASCIHLDDFSGLLARPFRPGWRLWRGDACFNAPPPRAALLPGWLAHLDDDGTLVPTPAEHSWLHLLSGAPALRSLALENGDQEESSATAPALHVVLCSLREAPALRKLALGFFDELRSEQLLPLLQLRRLTRLELSHIPDFSDALLLAVCHSLRALTHLRLDYLSVSDSGFAQLSSLKSLEWLELRACPFVQFGPVFPFDDLTKLSTLRLDPPGGDRPMRVSHIASSRLVAAAKRVQHLCIGFRPKSASSLPFFEMAKLEVMPRRLQSLQMHASQFVTWPHVARTWPAATTLHTLVLDVPCEWVLLRLRHLPALRDLTICDCSGMNVTGLDGIAGATELRRLVLGKFPQQLLLYTHRLLRWLPYCTEAHFHDCAETPLFFSTELLNSKGPLGQIWILANMPSRASKLSRQKAASLSVVDSCQQLIEPKAPLALRLAAVLMRGVVQLYSRQLFFLSEDATAVLLNLKSHIVAPGMDKHVLEERRQQARPDQITRELDTYELMQLLDYGGGGDNFDSALLAAASQGADSFFMVNPEDLRRLEAAERNAGSHGAPSFHNRSTSRRRGADANINLPDEDMITGEDGVPGDGTSLSAGGHRSMFAPYDEEFEALPDDAEEGGFAAPPALARSGSGAAAGALVPIGELEDEFYVPPPPDEEEFAPMPDEQADAEALEGGAQPKRKSAPKRQKKGILRSTQKVDDAIQVDGEEFASWLHDCTDILYEGSRPKFGDAVVLGRLGVRLDLAMQTPSMIVLEPFEGLGKRPRELCEPLAAVFARHAKALGRRRGASAAAPSPSASAEALQLMVEADDVEAFRHDAGGSVDGVPIQSPDDSLGGGSRGAGAGFGRRSGLSGGSGSLLAQALAAPSPKSGSGRAGRGSDAFGSMRAGDLPGAGGEDFFDAPYPDADADYGAVGLPFGGGDGGVGLSAPFESLLETGPDGTQTQRDPKKALSGVSIGLIKYFTEALSSTASQEAAITVEDMCASGRLNRTQRAQLFSQILILASNAFIKVKQNAPYESIVICRGTAAMA